MAMTGPEAYQHAETLAGEAYNQLLRDDHVDVQEYAAVAQAYAALARAAAALHTVQMEDEARLYGRSRNTSPEQ